MRIVTTLVVLIVALGAITLAVAHAPSRWEAVAPDLLPNLDFSAGGAGWRASGPGVLLAPGDPPTLRLDAGASRRGVYVLRGFQLSGDGFDHLRLRASVRADALEGIERAQVRLSSFDRRSRQVWYVPRIVVDVRESGGWGDHELVVPTADEVVRFVLSAFVAARSGALEVRGLSLDGVREADAFAFARRGLAGAWIAIAGIVLVILTRRDRRSPSRLAVIALAAALVVAGVAPQPYLRDSIEASMVEARELATSLADAVGPRDSEESVAAAPGAEPGAEAAGSAAAPTAPPPPGPGGDDARERADQSGGEPAALAPRWSPPRWALSDKLGHVLSFALLGALAAFAYRRYPRSACVGSLALLAGCIQVLQSLTETRDASFDDLIGDATGIAIGAALGYGSLAAYRVSRNRRAAIAGNG